MIKIVSCFCNVENYIEKCLDSVLSQKNKNFKMFLIDDLSTDSTIDKIKKKINNDDRFHLIINNQKKFKLKNLHQLLSDENLFDNDDIVLELDGDDWLFYDYVIDLIYEKYNNNKKLWLTNGSFIFSDGSVGFSSKVNHNSIRKDKFKFSHLRTWKCHLWRSIKLESFIDIDNNFYKAGVDVAYCFPMVEMAGDEHYEFIPNILYVYNEKNPLSNHKPDSLSGKSEQSRVAKIIRNKPKYKLM
jgi:glycosyltransferase involved in cell wall biosynthesis